MLPFRLTALLLALCLAALPACQENTSRQTSVSSDTTAAALADTFGNARDTAASARRPSASADTSSRSATAARSGASSSPAQQAGGPRDVPKGGYTTTPSGLKYHVFQKGAGAAAQPGDRVRVHYTGWLRSDSTKFDSSRDRGRPFTFRIGGRVIDGWNEGVAGMKVGETRQLVVPPKLAYGQRQRGPIPANSTLIFNIELLGIAGQ